MDEYVSRCKGMDHLSRWLGAHYLGPFERALRDDIGVTEYDDLAYLEDKELVSIGVDSKIRRHFWAEIADIEEDTTHDQLLKADLARCRTKYRQQAGENLSILIMDLRYNAEIKFGRVSANYDGSDWVECEYEYASGHKHSRQLPVNDRGEIDSWDCFERMTYKTGQELSFDYSELDCVVFALRPEHWEQKTHCERTVEILFETFDINKLAFAEAPIGFDIGPVVQHILGRPTGDCVVTKQSYDDDTHYASLFNLYHGQDFNSALGRRVEYKNVEITSEMGAVEQYKAMRLLLAQYGLEEFTDQFFTVQGLSSVGDLQYYTVAEISKSFKMPAGPLKRMMEDVKNFEERIKACQTQILGGIREDANAEYGSYDKALKCVEDHLSVDRASMFGKSIPER